MDNYKNYQALGEYDNISSVDEYDEEEIEE